MDKIVRQGDVMLFRVAKLPKGAVLVKTKGDVILAHGEVTGHAHRIKRDQTEKPSARIFDLGAERYLQIAERVALTHEEHGAILLSEGIYRQAFQVEDFGEEVRRVAD